MRCARNSALLALFLTGAAAQQTYSFPGRVLDKKNLDAAHSVVLVDMEKSAADRWALYVVSNPDNREVLALNTRAEGFDGASPVLEAIGPHSAYLHFYSDYGFYQGSLKFLFDPSAAGPPVKIRYDILSLTAVTRDNSILSYTASFGQQRASVIIQPRESALPSYSVKSVAAPAEQSTSAPSDLRGAGGEVVKVQNTTPPGQPHRPSMIFVDQKAYPAPIPTLNFYRQKLPQNPAPEEMESDIGPFVQSGDQIWFATTFYDGEGISGLGAIGAFDIASRKYEMRYLPEIAPWSESAILLDGHDLWIGLVRHPEGADIGGGLLRYNIASGAIQTFAIPDVIYTLDRVGDAIYCGTSHGLYMLRGDRITQLRFEPNEAGQLVMIPRAVPAAAHASAR